MTLALYVPGATAVHRCPAGAKLLVLAGLGALLFAVPTLPVVVGALAAVVLVGLAVARLPGAVLARQARLLLWWLVALFAVHALVTDVPSGTVAVLRLLTLVLAAAVVTATTRVTEMVAVVERLCAPLRMVGARPARIGLLVALALRFIPVLVDRADRIREAQAARGGSVRGVRSLTTTVVPLLISVLRMATAVGEALDARGAADAEPPPRRARRADRARVP